MATAAMLIALAITAILCVIFICITKYVSKLIYSEMGKVAGKDTLKQSKEPSRGFIAEEAFAEPFCASFLCAVLGNGVQTILILVPFLVANIALVFELNAPKYTEAATKAVALLHLLLGVTAGDISVLLLKALKNGNTTFRGCIKVSFLTGLMSFGTFFFFRSMLRYDTIRISAEDAKFLSIWLCLSMPITLLGGYIATHRPIQLSVPVNGSPQIIGVKNHVSWTLLLVFGCTASQLGGYVILSMLFATWRHNSLIMSVILLAEVILLGISHLASWLVLHNLLNCLGKLRSWCWKSFFALGCPSGISPFLMTAPCPLYLLNNSSKVASFTVSLLVSLITGLTFTMIYGTFSFLLILSRYPRRIAAATSAVFAEPV